MIEITLYMVRVGRRGEVALVAAIAGARRARIRRRVAGLAINREMRSGQCEAGGGMIPIRGRPGCCRVTSLALGRESGQGMLRIGLRVK